MANVSSNWQDSLDRGLVNRLTRPLRQPGMMKMAMSQRIINRCDRFLNRLPLLSQQIQRWGNTKTLSSDSVPIVYAQPISLAKEQGIGIGETVSKNHSSISIIQRKIDSPSPSSQDERTTLKPTSIDLAGSGRSKVWDNSSEIGCGVTTGLFSVAIEVGLSVVV